MVSSSDSRNISLALGGAALAALGCAAYYQYVNSSSSGKGAQGKRKRDLKSGDVTQSELSELLDELIGHQDQLKVVMAAIQKEILKDDLSFEQVCELVETRSTPSPLEKYELSVARFSQLLAEHNGDPAIRNKIMLLTSGADPMKSEKKIDIGELAGKFSVESIIEIHSYMLKRLKETIVVATITKKTNPRLATLAAQSYVGKLVQFQYGLTCDELEALACHYQQALSSDERFFEIGTELRHTLAKLTQMCTSDSSE